MLVLYSSYLFSYQQEYCLLSISCTSLLPTYRTSSLLIKTKHFISSNSSSSLELYSRDLILTESNACSHMLISSTGFSKICKSSLVMINTISKAYSSFTSCIRPTFHSSDIVRVQASFTRRCTSFSCSGQLFTHLNMQMYSFISLVQASFILSTPSALLFSAVLRIHKCNLSSLEQALWIQYICYSSSSWSSIQLLIHTESKPYTCHLNIAKRSI